MMINSKFKKICAFAVAMSLSAVLVLTGCGANETGGSAGDGGASAVSSETVNQVSYEITPTWANGAYIESGDEALPKLIQSTEARKINMEEEDLIFAVRCALDVLADESALELCGDENAVTMVSDDYVINGVKITDGICEIDLDSESALSQSMYTEMFFIYQVTDTILNSFSEISAVQFTLDGQPAEELGYMSVSEPFDADAVAEFKGEAAA